MAYDALAAHGHERNPIWCNGSVSVGGVAFNGKPHPVADVQKHYRGNRVLYYLVTVANDNGYNMPSSGGLVQVEPTGTWILDKHGKKMSIPSKRVEELVDGILREYGY